MENIIDLISDYYFIIQDESINKNVINIKNLKWKSRENFIHIDFEKINKNEYKKILKKFLHIYKLKSMTKNKIGVKSGTKVLLGYISNYDKKCKEQNDFIEAICAILFKKKKERYNYIYDTVCDFLDSGFYGENLCDFKENKCGEKRNSNLTCGCCRHYKIKLIGPITPWVVCEHLKEDHTCGAKCLSCKLYTCDYLKRKGIRYRIKDILLLDVFFNPIQKYFIKYMVYTPKEKIIKRLMFL